MNSATLELEPHQGRVTVSLEVRNLTAMERLLFVLASVRAVVSGRAAVRIPNVRTTLRGTDCGACGAALPCALPERRS